MPGSEAYTIVNGLSVAIAAVYRRRGQSISKGLDHHAQALRLHAKLRTRPWEKLAILIRLSSITLPASHHDMRPDIILEQGLSTMGKYYASRALPV